MDDELTGYEEHLAYEAGCFSNDYEAAYAVSQINRRPDDRAKIDALVKAGRFVVYYSLEDCCPHTDALLGERRSFDSDHATREEADAVVAARDEREREDMRIEPYLLEPRPTVVASDDEDLPF